MESLPPEMVQEVAQHLTPQDLARCCAVSRGWREVYNKDSLWKPHCDPSLEKSLRTTPSVVQPEFVVPGSGSKDSILTPIGHWRLAFMREHHLWGNWKKKLFRKVYFYYPSIKDDRRVFNISFLTDTLFATWRLNCIEVWDVSSIQPALVVKTNPLIGVPKWNSLSIVGRRMLVVKLEASIQVFLIDVNNKRIDLKHEIPLDQKLGRLIVKQVSVGETRAVGVTSSKSNCKLVIFDLEKGEKIKEEHCPVIENKRSESYRIEKIPLSEDILVLFESGDEKVFYMYSPKELLFRSGPISFGEIDHISDYATNKHYIALRGFKFLVIVDYLTSEVVFKHKYHSFYELKAYKDSFIFLECKDGKHRLQLFSLENKTVTTIFEYVQQGPERSYCNIEIVNNKFVELYTLDFRDNVINVASFKPSGHSLKQIDTFFSGHADFSNMSLTRGCNFHEIGSFFDYYW